tara:strand:- start:40804 stop:41235 length:432 start_codon:yes stop_codon:yes gene_type:complete
MGFKQPLRFSFDTTCRSLFLTVTRLIWFTHSEPIADTRRVSHSVTALVALTAPVDHSGRRAYFVCTSHFQKGAVMTTMQDLKNAGKECEQFNQNYPAGTQVLYSNGTSWFASVTLTEAWTLCGTAYVLLEGAGLTPLSRVRTR